MNREDIIRMAQEAGDEWDHTLPEDKAFLERFAAIVAAASDEKWKQAVINELVCCYIYNESHDQDPRKAVHDAISWNVEVALDPRVSSQAQALIDLGASIEREACARFVEDGYVRQFEKPWREDLAAAIRARSKE